MQSNCFNRYLELKTTLEHTETVEEIVVDNSKKNKAKDTDKWRTETEAETYSEKTIETKVRNIII